MKLTFAHKNICINEILDYSTVREIKDFSDRERGHGLAIVGHWEVKMEIVDQVIANLANEILQIINTTNQETIDTYFNQLIDNVDYVDGEFDLKSIVATCLEWNNGSLKTFNQKIEEAEARYFENENRKLKHLEEYEDYRVPKFLFLGQKEKIKKINYNFYCAEDELEYIDIDIVTNEYSKVLAEISNKLHQTTDEYIFQFLEGSIKSKFTENQFFKPLLVVEGDHDVKYINHAGELYGENDLLAQIDIRQLGGYGNMDQFWSLMKDFNWEAKPQKKILLYDCDIDRKQDSVGFIYKRTTPIQNDRLILKGIENLFPNSLIKKAMSEQPKFFDIIRIERSERGKKPTSTETISINRQEKTNFCEWACANGTKDDFMAFYVIFDIIREVINKD